MPPIFVNARKLAEKLEVGYGTVLSWTRRGRIPHIRDGRGRLLFNLDAVMRALSRPVDLEAAGREGGQ